MKEEKKWRGWNYKVKKIKKTILKKKRGSNLTY
jgi:hypothetical protein